jgi:O-antigen ligase
LPVAGLTALPVVAAALSIGFFGGRLVRRVLLDGLVDEARICTYASTWRAIKDNFWLGTGLGTFEDIFPGYRMPECSLYGHWNAAHNVFLEGWLSLGVVFLACTGLVYYQLIRTYVQGLRDRRRMRFIPLVSLCALLLISLHSLVDFSVQTPAVAVLVAVLLASGAAVSLGRAREGAAAEGARSTLSPRGLPPVHQPHPVVGA